MLLERSAEIFLAAIADQNEPLGHSHILLHSMAASAEVPHATLIVNIEIGARKSAVIWHNEPCLAAAAYGVHQCGFHVAFWTAAALQAFAIAISARLDLEIRESEQLSVVHLPGQKASDAGTISIAAAAEGNQYFFTHKITTFQEDQNAEL